jgi:hypothetical protein
MQPNDDQQPMQPVEQPQPYAPPVQSAPQQFQDQSAPTPPVEYAQPQAESVQQPQPVQPPVANQPAPQYEQPTAPVQPASAPFEQQTPVESQIDIQPEQQPVQAEQPVFTQPATESVNNQPLASLQPNPSESIQQAEQYQAGPTVEVDQPTQQAPIAPVTWQAQEYLQQDKPPLWYVVFAGVVIVFMGISIWLQAWTFAVLIPIMAAALAVYAHRPPRMVNYSVSEKGLTINGQLHPMGEFKSFGVLKDSQLHALMLVPVKRFRPGVTLYFPEEVGEPLVDTLGAYLPMQDLHVDMVDKIIQKLRI